MQDEILRALVWTDYRLTLLFMVFIPLTLIIWAALKKADAMVRLLIIYWRVASLLGITLFILIASWPIGFVSNFCAYILIPISLWFWVDLNDEIDDQSQSSLKLALTSWRWAVTIYCTCAAIATIPFLRCAFVSGAIETTFCQVWTEAPLVFRGLFLTQRYEPGVWGFLGVVGLIFYVLYLGYFVIIRLGKQGRSAMEQ
ncbi:MAG: DUF3177 family protein [Symploca sp. SIO1B1]|nr:DUF3177 family protein [Symploca sp. SIO1C2]NER49884.1 DUF3177 family protein [Symploca sp. SIO1A3]NER95728.1 DUF3177 family protein [Symploca sp. SIO1B1]